MKKHSLQNTVTGYPSTSTTAHTTSVDWRAPWGVTGNVLELPGAYAVPPGTLNIDADHEGLAETAAWLDTAAPLALDAKPSTAESHALVDALTAMVAAHGGTRRGPKLRAKLADAVAAIVGSLLKNWARSPARPVFRSGKAASFSDGPIAYRQFTAAMAGLEGLGFVVRQQGYQRAIDWGDVKSWFGKAARFWPSAGLLRLVAEHGITAENAQQHFRASAPKRPPIVRKLVAVNSMKRTIGYVTGQGHKEALKDDALGADLERIRNGVEQANAFAAEQDVRGCLPPRWKRVFTVNSLLGGRWIAVGREGVYQTMSEGERLARITINGEPVVEADVQASHLSIMHGLLGLPLPPGDLYEFPKVPRPVVKAWITATLGKGTPVTKWAIKAAKDNPDLGGHDPKRIGRIICDRYPFLTSPAAAVAVPAGLDRLKDIDTPARLLTHRLMAIEAQALTGAMEYLRASRGVLALPMHDGLIVPLSGERHVGGGLDGAFATLAKVRVRWTIKGPDAAG